MDNVGTQGMPPNKAMQPTGPKRPAADGQRRWADVSMAISESHASHILRVRVGFVVSGADLDPDQVSRALGLLPHSKALQGQPKRNLAGGNLGTEEEGWWRLESVPAVHSKDINEHFDYLLALLLPHREFLVNSGSTFFDVLWESTYLYAGTGPVMSRQTCEGIAALGAGLGFDIYQVDEDDPTRHN